MSRPNSRKITKRMVDALRTKRKPDLAWDRDLPGFGVRLCHRQNRLRGAEPGPHGSRRATLGRHGDLTPMPRASWRPRSSTGSRPGRSLSRKRRNPNRTIRWKNWRNVS